MTNEANAQGDGHHLFHIQIDRVHYEVPTFPMTGAQIRSVPNPPIGPERDLFEVIPGQPDKKINDVDLVEIHNGQRFFTAPAHINPGYEPWGRGGQDHVARY